MILNKTNSDWFIEKARKLYGEKYSYEKVDYFRLNVKVTICCPIHGDFDVFPSLFLSGSYCWGCRFEKKSKEFIEESIKVHGNLYDYSKVEYKGSKEKVCIICKKHGEFFMLPRQHTVRKHGCRKCSNEKGRKSTIEYLKLFKDTHGDVYDYSKFIYKNYNEKVIVICRHHGEFKVLPNAHIYMESGCPKCSVSGFKTDKPAVFYILKINGNSEFTGFGISTKYKTRKSTHKKNLKANNCSIISEILIHSDGLTIQQLEQHIKQTLQCRNSSIEGFRTESVLISPEELKIFCENHLQSLGISYKLSTNT